MQYHPNAQGENAMSHAAPLPDSPFATIYSSRLRNNADRLAVCSVRNQQSCGKCVTL